MQVCVASTVSMAGKPSVSLSVMLSIESRLSVLEMWSVCPTGDILDRFRIVSVFGESEGRAKVKVSSCVMHWAALSNVGNQADFHK